MARSLPANGNAKILVAEREYVVALDIKEILGRSGYEVIGCVSSGEEVLHIANEQKIDLLIIDMNLDGKLSGIKASTLVLEKVDIPIIFLTCSKRSNNIDAIDKNFPSVFITKPFAPNDLCTCIETALCSYNYCKAEQKSNLDDERC